ncbi:unnamed protein product [Gordionus sp. m RMFG-2023]
MKVFSSLLELRATLYYLYYTLALIHTINGFCALYLDRESNEEKKDMLVASDTSLDFSESFATTLDDVEWVKAIDFDESKFPDNGRYLISANPSSIFPSRKDDSSNSKDQNISLEEKEAILRVYDSQIKNIFGVSRPKEIRDFITPSYTLLPPRSINTNELFTQPDNHSAREVESALKPGSKRGTLSDTGEGDENINAGFKTFWNIPTDVCRDKLGVEIPLSTYGIIANEEQKFFGSKISIFYLREGLWPHYKNSDARANKRVTSGKIISKEILFGENDNDTLSELIEINGGIPQRGDLETHLKSFAESVRKLIPDSGFDGMAVIDFEEYTLSLKVLEGKLRDVYKQKSMEFAKEQNPDVTDVKELKDISAKLFNSAARLFFESTLKLGIQMRPNAKWGYYGFPYCYKNELDNLKCCERMSTMNDENLWLYEASTALFPAIYIYNKPLPRPMDPGIWIHKIYNEVNRLRDKVKSKYLPVYPYFRFEYPAEEGQKYEPYLEIKDLKFSYKQALDMGMDGMIIWASSKRLEDKCQNISQYLKDYLGPMSRISKLFAKNCQSLMCHNPVANAKSESGTYDSYKGRNSHSFRYEPVEGKCVKIDFDNLNYIHKILHSTDHINSTYPKRPDKIKSQYKCKRISNT